MELPNFFRRQLYNFCFVLVYGFFAIVWRIRFVGRENLPKEGGVLLACNHASNADPPIMGIASRRPIFYFAKDELFRIPVFGWFIRQLNAFPVRRLDHDIGAFKQAQHLIKKNQVLLIFPEGRRSKDGRIGRAKAGIAMIAFKTQAPIVPACIINSYAIHKLRQIKVVFGPPMVPTPTQIQTKNYEEFADQVMNAIADLYQNNV